MAFGRKEGLVGVGDAGDGQGHGECRTYRSVVWRRKRVWRGIKNVSCAATRGGCGDAVANVRNGSRRRSSAGGSAKVGDMVAGLIGK